jgi:hypothetical protein
MTFPSDYEIGVENWLTRMILSEREVDGSSSDCELQVHLSRCKGTPSQYLVLVEVRYPLQINTRYSPTQTENDTTRAYIPRCAGRFEIKITPKHRDDGLPRSFHLDSLFDRGRG